MITPGSLSGAERYHGDPVDDERVIAGELGLHPALDGVSLPTGQDSHEEQVMDIVRGENVEHGHCNKMLIKF